MSKVPHKIQISNLRRVRVAKHMRQMDLSALSGVPVKVIGNYEQLRRDINHARVDIVYRLAQTLECDMLDILDLDKLVCKNQ